MAELRYRRGDGPPFLQGPRVRELSPDEEVEETTYPPKPPATAYDDDDDISLKMRLLDVLRIIVVLVLCSSALSYYLTNESFLWGSRPWFTRWPVLKRYLAGPINLTIAELALYNGTDRTLPLYIAVNGTIFDVSVGRHFYGPGGGYSAMGGADATRAFLTGCFSDDVTPDLRGVEVLYVPVEDEAAAEDEAERALTPGQKKIRREREWREARKLVHKQVDGWLRFYRNSRKYWEVGKVVDGPGPEGKGLEMRPLCDQAQKMRPRRSELNAAGKRKEKDPNKPWEGPWD